MFTPRRWVSTLVTVMLILAVVLCLYVTIQVMSNGYVSLAGHTMFRVVTGSMEPTIPTGALLVAKECDISAVGLGDIVCFKTRSAEIWGSIVTHRVVEVLQNDAGELLLRTQGDANLAADGYLVAASDLIGKVIWHTGDDSVVASIFAFFTNKVGFLGCIVIPCLLLAGLILKECVSNIHRELKSAVEEMDEEASQGMSPEEYAEMCEKIKAELIEELKQSAEKLENSTEE